MSLIEEALRRAQTTSTPSPTPPEEPPPLKFSQPERRLSAKWWIGLAVGGTTAVVLALWGYAIVWRWQLAKIADLPPAHQPVVNRATSPTELPRAAAIQPAVAQAPANLKPVPSPVVTSAIPRRKRPPQFTLNGIVQGRGEPLAIINGMILRVGESVSGATLLTIRGDEATLRWRDEELVLSTTH